VNDVTERFVEVVHRAPDTIPLDEAMLLIAAHAHPSLDLAARLEQLDALADAVRVRDPDGVAQWLFGPAGFTGNTTAYYDPANSYLDDVLDRRLGIPITLSILMMEVARRVEVQLVGVGMPGHFLVGVPDPGADDRVSYWYDPFHGPDRIGFAECAALFARSHAASPDDLRVEQLAPVGSLAILDRVLANLQSALLRRDPASAVWPTRLRLRLPSVSRDRRVELATTLGNLGQFGEAAAVFDALADELDPGAAARAQRAASQLRARAN